MKLIAWIKLQLSIGIMTFPHAVRPVAVIKLCYLGNMFNKFMIGHFFLIYNNILITPNSRTAVAEAIIFGFWY